jgi:hypothetical protein
MQPSNSESWNQYIGTIWQRLFEIYSLPITGTIVEVAPGEVNKIGHGLKNYQFSGKLYVVEPNGLACEKISQEYALFKCRNITDLQDIT